MKILLNNKRSLSNQNVSNFTLTTSLAGSKKLLPNSILYENLNESDLYNRERQNCNLIRLNCVINPICTNILHNSLTEIIKNEGDPNAVKLLNYGTIDGFIDNNDFDKKIYCKDANTFAYNGVKESIKDTQISSVNCGFKYLCGVDMFNNHIIRSNTFKTVCYNAINTDAFNTINDFMRNENGEFIEGYDYAGSGITKQHLYLKDEIDSYTTSINNKLIEKNGWFGFINKGKFLVVDNNNEPMDIFRVINYRRSCDFIQMYPSSDLWSFTPKYNKTLHRVEKNWNYCLTYPSSSTTKNISFIRENTNSLKIIYFNDKITLKNGVNGIKLYSVCKHGLKIGDYINLYKNDDIIFNTCEVKDIENEYIFYIANPSTQLSQSWYELTASDVETNGVDDFFLKRPIDLKTVHFIYKDKQTGEEKKIDGLTFSTVKEISVTDIIVDEKSIWETINYHGIKYKLKPKNSSLSKYEFIINPEDIDFDLDFIKVSNTHYDYTIKNPRVNIGIQYIISNDRKKVFCGEGDDRSTYYLIDNKFVNLDDEYQDLSYKKIVENEELEYYVRIFSKIPNWKGCDFQINEQELYNSDKNLISKYQTLEHEFENHVSDLSFAKNIYGDNLSQIVFSDDIDLSYLKDNLGRPLTSIYLTILKNNKGYKEWYGKNGGEIEIRKRQHDETKDYHIEYSHCFGMLNCAFRLSKESLPSTEHNNAMQINNIDSSFQFQGLDVEDLQFSNKLYNSILGKKNTYNNSSFKDERPYRSNFPQILNDEIQYGYYYDKYNKIEYHGDTHFYGDLCSYSKNLLLEEPIQQIEMRFNTAQRELSSLDTSFKYFNKLYYDEIISDDKDQNGFVTKEYEVLKGNQHKEGYCYHPHYEIPIKSFSTNITTQTSIFMTIRKIENISTTEERKSRFRFTTMNPHNLEKYEKINLKYKHVDPLTNTTFYVIYYTCMVIEINGSDKFECYIYDENNELVKALDLKNFSSYKLFKKDSLTPDYASIMRDGSCRFMWREVLNNGFDIETTNETYPFMNGAFYVNKHINLYVKRQDPKFYTSLQNSTFINDASPNIDESNDNDNINTENIC